MTVCVALDGCRVLGPGQLDGVEIVIGEPATRAFPARVSTGLGICLKYGASHDVTIGGRRAIYPADSVSLRAPGCVWSSGTGAHGFLSIDFARDLLPDMRFGGSMWFAARDRFPDVAAAAGRLLCADSSLEAGEIAAELIGAALLARPGAAAAGPRRRVVRPRAVDDACEFLAANLAGRPTLEQTAAAAGVSKFTLLRRFRKALGTTPHAYLTMLRLERTRELLARGVPAAMVAQECGFADQAHMGLRFRRAMGTTPGAYARQARSAVSISS
jgi:AraC-like DNA-binding protein